MALADSTFVIRASFPERRILAAILRSNVIQPILRVARHPLGATRRKRSATSPGRCRFSAFF
jgi:hypothetical protein